MKPTKYNTRKANPKTVVSKKGKTTQVINMNSRKLPGIQYFFRK